MINGAVEYKFEILSGRDKDGDISASINLHDEVKNANEIFNEDRTYFTLDLDKGEKRSREKGKITGWT